MSDVWETQRAKDKVDEALHYASKSRYLGRRHFKFSGEKVAKLLDVLLPQYFDLVTSATRTALYQIDPSWKKGQFDVFSRHFRMNLLRSFFTPRFLLNDSKVPILREEQILETILDASQHFDDDEKAAFYGTILSEYILRCPEARFPAWSDSYKDKPNWITIWNLHSTLWQYFYW